MTTEDHVEERERPGEETTKAAGKVRRALGLSFLNTIFGRLGTFLTGILLARILIPEDFGAFAVALVALSGMLAINELGVSLALVRWQGDPREIAPTVTTISFAFSALLYAVCWTAAPAFSEALGSPDATGVVRLLSVAVLIDGATAAAAQFVNREFRQGVRLVVDLSNLAITTAVTVGLALNDHGAWSLAWGRLVGNAIAAVLLFRLVALWPKPGLNRMHLKELLAFGIPLAGASMLVFAMLNVDYIVTGHLLGAVALGLYLQAFNLASWPVNMFSAVIRRVSLAAFARVQDDREHRERVLAHFTTLLFASVLPVCALLGLLALPVVSTLYGSVWIGSAAALQFLALLGVVRVATELAYDYLVALGLAGRTVWLQGLWLVALVVGLPVGALLDGIRGVAAAHALIAVLLVLPAFTFAVCRTGVSLRVLAEAVLRPAIGCAALVAVVLVVRRLTEPGVVQLLVASAAGLAVHVAVVWPVRRLVKQLG